jgi:hypothetical protein
MLCMDDDDVSNATVCPKTQCTTCWNTKERLSDPDFLYLFGDTKNIRERVAEERKKLLHRDHPRGGGATRRRRRCSPIPAADVGGATLPPVSAWVLAGPGRRIPSGSATFWVEH